MFILATLAPLRQVRKLPFWGESLLRKLHSEIVWLSGQILGLILFPIKIMRSDDGKNLVFHEKQYFERAVI